MRGDEMPVVTSRRSERHYRKTTLVTNEPPQRTISNELIPVSAEAYHEGYVGGKKYLVPESNLEAMRTLVNMKMRRRVSIQYKHQTSFDLDNTNLTHKLNSLMNKIDSIPISDDYSEKFDQWKKSFSIQENRDRVDDEESLSEIQVEVVSSYELLEDDVLSKDDISKNKMPTSLLEKVSESLENSRVEETRQNSIISTQTKVLRQHCKLSETKVLIDGKTNRKSNSIIERCSETQGAEMICNLSGILKPDELEKTYSITDKSRQNKKYTVEYQESLSDLQIQGEHPYGQLGEDGYSQDNSNKNNLVISNLFEEVSERSTNEGAEITKQHSKVPLTKKLRSELSQTNVFRRTCSDKPLEELDLSQDSESNMTIPTTNFIDVMSVRSENKEIKRSRKSSEPSQTKIINEEINKEANSIVERSSETQDNAHLTCDLLGTPQSEKLGKTCSFTTKGRDSFCDSISIPPSTKSVAYYNATSCDNSNASLRMPMVKENKKTVSVLEKLLSNANLSRFFRANKDNKICSITSNNGNMQYNPLKTTQAKFFKNCESTKKNKETFSITKLFSNTNPPKISKVNKDLPVSYKKGSVNFDQLTISQSNVINNCDPILITDYKMRGTCYSQQLTPLTIVIDVDSNSCKNTKECQKSSLRQQNEVFGKHTESTNRNSSHTYLSRENNQNTSLNHKGLNNDINNKSRQLDYKIWKRQKMKPIKIILDVETNDSNINTSVNNQENISRLRSSLQSNPMGEGGDCTLKREIAYVEVQTESSHSVFHNSERSIRDKIGSRSNFLLEDRLSYQTQQLETSKIQNAMEFAYFKKPQLKNKDRHILNRYLNI